MKHNALLTVRLSKSQRDKFKKTARRFGEPSQVHRELIEAFNDGRMTIKPKEGKENLYES